MGVDFITLIAQVLNLALLIWLLKRFLYRPIVSMIEQRQALIDNEIKKAKQATRDAMAEEALYQKKLADFDAKRTQMLSDVKTEVDVLRESLTKETREALRLSKKNWQTELVQEKAAFDASLQDSIVQNFKLFAADALKDMAGVELSALVMKKFKGELEKMSATARKQFHENVVQNPHIIVSTDVKLSMEDRTDLKSFLVLLFDLSDVEKLKMTYRQNAALICGVELLVGEQMTSWNLQRYLEAFENNMDAAFNELVHQGA